MPEYPSELYKLFRPKYPSKLFEIIYDKCTLFGTAVDVGCGTGITTKVLSSKFKRVIGLDPSEDMLLKAEKGPEYLVGTAEDIPMADSSVDLITCSTAAHWFVMEEFYKEAFRILKDGGILAYWLQVITLVGQAPFTSTDSKITLIPQAYGHFYTPDYPKISELAVTFSTVDMGPYWDSRRPRLDRMYSDSDFLTSPFNNLTRVCYDDKDQDCLMIMYWSINQIQGFLSTWSPYKTWLERHDGDGTQDPMKKRIEEIKEIVKGDGEFRLEVCFPVVLITCQK